MKTTNDPWFGIWNGFLLLMPPCPWSLDSVSLLSFYYCHIYKSYIGDLWYHLTEMHFGVSGFRKIALFPSHITKDNVPGDFSSDVTPVVVPDSFRPPGDDIMLRVLGYGGDSDDSPIGEFNRQCDLASSQFTVEYAMP